MYGERRRNHNSEKLSLCCKQLSLLEMGIKMFIVLLLPPHLPKQGLLRDKRDTSLECTTQSSAMSEEGEEIKTRWNSREAAPTSRPREAAYPLQLFRPDGIMHCVKG